MIISHKYKLIFIHIPKNAGTFITQLLKNLDENLDIRHIGHIISLEGEKLVDSEIWNTYKKFCVIRNSWDHLISLYNYIKIEKYHFINDLMENVSFEEFICYIKKNFGNSSFETTFFYQKNFLLDENNEIMVDYLINFNNLEADLLFFLEHIAEIDFKTIIDAMPKEKINQSTTTDDNLYYYDDNLYYYDDNLINIVYDIYKEDINFFKFAAPKKMVKDLN